MTAPGADRVDEPRWAALVRYHLQHADVSIRDRRELLRLADWLDDLPRPRAGGVDPAAAADLPAARAPVVDVDALKRSISVALRAPLMALYAHQGFHNAKRNTDRVSREVAEDAVTGLDVLPSVGRDALGTAISESRYASCEHNPHERCSDCIADALLAAGVVQDAGQVRTAARREVAEELAAQRIQCPVHGITDCSPLLNGCSVPNHIANWRDRLLIEAARTEEDSGV